MASATATAIDTAADARVPRHGQHGPVEAGASLMLKVYETRVNLAARPEITHLARRQSPQDSSAGRPVPE